MPAVRALLRGMAPNGPLCIPLVRPHELEGDASFGFYCKRLATEETRSFLTWSRAYMTPGQCRRGRLSILVCGLWLLGGFGQKCGKGKCSSATAWSTSSDKDEGLCRALRICEDKVQTIRSRRQELCHARAGSWSWQAISPVKAPQNRLTCSQAVRQGEGRQRAASAVEPRQTRLS